MATITSSKDVGVVWQLSDAGRSLTYKAWCNMGGCGVPNNSVAPVKLGPEAYWEHKGVTLGEIEDACPGTGRALARFAVEHLNRSDLAKPYEPYNPENED